MHPDYKKGNGKQDKSELGDIKEYPIKNREDEHIYKIDDRIYEEEGQPCQKFEFTPFHRQDNSSESDSYLKKSIKY